MEEEWSCLGSGVSFAKLENESRKWGCGLGTGGVSKSVQSLEDPVNHSRKCNFVSCGQQEAVWSINRTR